MRIWVDAAGLFARAADGTEQLTEPGRRRLESAMADLVRYPRDSPLIVEGYADSTAGEAAYLISSDRAALVREYLLSRFRRRVTLTGIMPMSDQAVGSPRGDRWSGVALALFVTKRRAQQRAVATLASRSFDCSSRRMNTRYTCTLSGFKRSAAGLAWQHSRCFG